MCPSSAERARVRPRLWAVAVAAAVAWATRALAVAGSLLPLDAERLHASVGGYAVMNCHLDFPFGNEIPYHLQWDKDGESIYSWYSVSAAGEASARVADRWGGRVRRLGDGRLGLGRGSINVSAVRETDAGLYRCRVTFPNRTPPARNNGTFYYLEVEGGNLIVTPPMNVTVLEGERATLECLPKSAESTVEWYRDGEPLENTPELALRCDLGADGTLVIRSAASTDPGEYSCRVRDPAGATQSASAFLDVQYKAKVVYAPKERYLPLGKPASLDCHFSANPPLTNLRWEKDGFLFDPYNVPGVFYSRNGSLLFNQVDESHEGQYSCTPYNALGTAGASPRVRVRVLRPPALSARPLPLYVARLGADLVLPCAIAADHDAALSWTRKEGGALPAGRHAVDAAGLTIMAVTEEDRGVYVCSAANEAATVAAESEVLVENAPPRAPRNLTAAPAAAAVHLTWQPAPSDLPLDYTVWYRERDASEWRTMKILSRGVTEATVTGLRPATEYELRVLSQDLIGDGLFSKPIYVRTLDADVSGAVVPVALEPSPGEAAYSAASSESPAPWAEGGEGGDGAEGSEGGDELQVSVRLLDEGALVRWSRGPEGAGRGAEDAGRCSVRWYEGDRLLAATHTHHDYFLVKEVSEGGSYQARVSCGAGGAGAAGAATLLVPQYGRLRAVAGGCVAAALLLAALGAALYLARHRVARVPCVRARARRPPPPPPKRH